jgi:AraC-like DNA-binding protein/quercetin dioxygenase-like cupin family protein
MKEILHIPPGLDGAAWHMEFARRNRHYLHRHDELEVNLVLHGRGKYLLADRTYDLTRCTQIWLFPEQNHVLLEYSPDFQMWVLVFKPALVQRACTTDATRPLLELNPATAYCKQLTEEQTRRLHHLFREVSEAATDPARHNAGLAYAMLAAWHAQLAADKIPGHADIHPAVERAVRLLRYEDTPLALADIARHAGLSPARLSRVFQEQTGQSITDFRNRQRLERFLTLTAAEPRKKMIQAALEAGFGSYPQFHRVFKQIMGCSPQAYRRRAT